MDVGTVAMIAIGVAAAVFVIFGYYWWEVRPVRRDDTEER
jgi:hypothetical protein